MTDENNKYKPEETLRSGNSDLNKVEKMLNEEMIKELYNKLDEEKKNIFSKFCLESKNSEIQILLLEYLAQKNKNESITVNQQEVANYTFCRLEEIISFDSKRMKALIKVKKEAINQMSEYFQAFDDINKEKENFDESNVLENYFECILYSELIDNVGGNATISDWGKECWRLPYDTASITDIKEFVKNHMIGTEMHYKKIIGDLFRDINHPVKKDYLKILAKLKETIKDIKPFLLFQGIMGSEEFSNNYFRLIGANYPFTPMELSLQCLGILSYGEIKKYPQDIKNLEELLMLNIEGYLPIKKIGEGGIRKTYKTIDKKHGDIFALKLNRPLSEINNPSAKRILKLRDLKELSEFEIKALKDLTHENLARMWDFGEFENRQYVIEEYVEGMTLEDLVKNKKGGLNDYEIGLIFYPLAQALTYLHQKGYVHRDIKPNNILISKDFSTVKLVDLQTARKMDEVGEYIGLSFGTEKTAAPEVLRGGKATKYSDMYALGSTMFYAMTGEYFNHEDAGKFAPNIYGELFRNGPSKRTVELIEGTMNDVYKKKDFAPARVLMYSQEQGLISYLLNDDPKKRFFLMQDLERYYEHSKVIQKGIKKGLNLEEMEDAIMKDWKKRIIEGNDK